MEPFENPQLLADFGLACNATPTNPEMTQFQLHRETPPGHGPIALFLHGLLSSRRQWQPNLPALSRHVRPVLVDLWGHGLSPAPPNDDAYTVESYVEQFELIRQSLNTQQIVLIAHSFGAGLAMQYAVRHPERVRAMVITNSTTAFADPEDVSMRESRERMVRALELEGSESIRALSMHPRRGKRLPPDLKDKLIAEADAIAPLAIIRAARVTAPQLSAALDLERIRCPVLLVNGRRESGFQRYADLAARTIPSCEIVNLEGGHAINLEDPEGFDRATTVFLARIARCESR